MMLLCNRVGHTRRLCNRKYFPVKYSSFLQLQNFTPRKICNIQYFVDGNFIMYKRIFVIILLRFPCVLPMECIWIKGNFEDESFADSNITTNFPKYTSLKIYCAYYTLYYGYIVHIYTLYE